jgi:hypothetical protein
VIALQQNLIAAADAHHLVADVVEARGGVSGAELGEDGEAQQDCLYGLPAGLGWLRLRVRLCH